MSRSKAKEIARRRLAEQQVEPSGQDDDDEDGGDELPPSKEKEPERVITPRVTSPYVPFPVDALAGALGHFVNDVAHVMGCDPGLVAMPCLAVTGGLIGNCRKIQVKRTWKEAPIIWAVTVADSSSTKSPAFRLIEEPLVEMQSSFRAALQMDKHAFIQDVTIETVASTLETNGRGAILTMDELTAWFGSFRRYDNSRSDCPQWCSLWQCGVLKKDRETSTKKNIFVPEACCSVTGTMTPGNLAQVFSTPGLFETGLLFRMLYCMPPSLNDDWNEDEVSDKNMRFWINLCKRMAGLEGKHVIQLDKGAKSLWIDYYRATRKRIELAPLTVRASIKKLRAYTLRFALLHHILGGSQHADVMPESMTAAIRLSQWFGAEADRVYTLRGESEDSRELRTLADQIANRPGGKISARDLQRGDETQFPHSDDAKAKLRTLADSGYGTIHEKGRQMLFVHNAFAAKLIPEELPAVAPTIEPALAEDDLPTLVDVDRNLLITSARDAETPPANTVPLPAAAEWDGIPINGLPIAGPTKRKMTKRGLTTIGDVWALGRRIGLPASLALRQELDIPLMFIPEIQTAVLNAMRAVAPGQRFCRECGAADAEAATWKHADLCPGCAAIVAVKRPKLATA